MALRYTGMADVLVVDGKPYRRGGGEDANGVKYGSFDHVVISKARAAALAADSRIHSFEDADGEDVLAAETAPAPAAPPPTTPAQAEAAKK